MIFTTVVFNILALVAACVCLSYTVGIWRMVRAPSRLALMVMSAWLVVARSVYLVITALPPESWVRENIAVVQYVVLIANLPMWFLLAYAFGLTYYELRRFHFHQKTSSSVEELGEALTQAEES